MRLNRRGSVSCVAKETMSKAESKAAADMTEAVGLRDVSYMHPVKYFFLTFFMQFRWRKRCSDFRESFRQCPSTWSPKISFLCDLFSEQSKVTPTLQLLNSTLGSLRFSSGAMQHYLIFASYKCVICGLDFVMSGNKHLRLPIKKLDTTILSKSVVTWTATRRRWGLWPNL